MNLLSTQMKGNKMKKGLRNTIAMATLAATNLFGAPKAKADIHPEAVVSKDEVVQVAKAIKETADMKSFEKKAQEFLETRITLSEDLKEFSEKNRIDLSKYKGMRIKTTASDSVYIQFDNQDTILKVGPDNSIEEKRTMESADWATLFGEVEGHLDTIDLTRKEFYRTWMDGHNTIESPALSFLTDVEKTEKISEIQKDLPKFLEKVSKEKGVDLSKHKKMEFVMLPGAGESGGYYVTIDSGKMFGMPSKEGIYPHSEFVDGSVPSDYVGTLVSVDLAKKSFSIHWDEMTASPATTYAQGKEKTKAKTMAPSVKKAISERLQKQ